jgi:hypothetical protein
MLRKIKQKWSSIPAISINRTITFRLNSLNTQKTTTYVVYIIKSYPASGIADLSWFWLSCSKDSPASDIADLSWFWLSCFKSSPASGRADPSWFWLSCLCALCYLLPKTFILFDFSICWLWTHLMMVIPESRHAD